MAKKSRENTENNIHLTASALEGLCSTLEEFILSDLSFSEPVSPEKHIQLSGLAEAAKQYSKQVAKYFDECEKDLALRSS
ncbi:MAG: hypothetical protein MJA83_00815 [Gammaproteobacteria bacterium]|nr:hypothetical protein [Gammaproteobacteria bacterium]